MDSTIFPTVFGKNENIEFGMKHGKFLQNVIYIDFVHCNIARPESKYNAVGTADILATCHLGSFFLTNRDQFKVSMLKNLSK